MTAPVRHAAGVSFRLAFCGQAGVVRSVTRSGHAIEDIEAAAGSGKTAAAAVIPEAYREAAWNVIGKAPTARAAQELDARGIESHTTHRLLHHPELIPEAPLQVLADEAGMSSTREGAFADTTLMHGASSLEQTHRQRDPSEFQALVMRNSVLARDVNEATRKRLIAGGQLGNERLDAGGVELRVGDRVICRRNDHPRDLQNGTRGTLTSFDASRAAVMRANDGRVLDIPTHYLDAGHVQHAYALTTGEHR